MRTSQTFTRSSVPENAIPSGGALAAEFRGLVQWAVDQRRFLMKNDLSKMPFEQMDPLVRRLETWLNEHPTYVSAISCNALWIQRRGCIALVMPGSKAGRKKMERMESIVFKL